jgi:hypothetical protein
MEYKGWKLTLGSFFALCCAGSLGLALSSGPPAAHTGDFGEANCTACHTGNPLNAPEGTLVISGVPANYQPGQTYPITISIHKAGQSRWGFEMAVRAVSSGQQTGTLAPTDGNTQVTTAGGIQYVTHTSIGTFANTSSGSWTVSWTAPATAQGEIRFGAAGNAANNNFTNQGDFIYTVTATAHPQGAVQPTTALFAQVATGGGYSTEFTLLNTGDAPVNGRLILTGQDGAPLSASLAEPGGAPVIGSESSISIPPGGARIVIANPDPADTSLKNGWARVESDGGAVSGVANFRLVSGGALTTSAGVLSAETVQSATIPVVDDQAAGAATGYAVANPSSTDTITIKIVMVNQDGTPAVTLSPITLEPGRQVARFFFQDPAASATFRGSAVLIGQDGRLFSVVALSQNQGILSAIPVTAAKAPHIN